MTDETYSATASEIRSFVERIERLDAQKAEIADLRKDVMSEAKALAKLISLRKKTRDEIAEEEAVLTMYREALGGMTNADLIKRCLSGAELYEEGLDDDDIAAALREAAAALQAMEWQPIETAPKDGTRFLAFESVNKKYHTISVCIWEKGADGEGPYMVLYHEKRNTPVLATHWKPL